MTALAATYLLSTEAKAGKYDLDLAALGEVQDDGTVTQRNQDFRSLASEVGVLMAPKPVDPADSLGLSGFAISADVTINTLGGDEAYWQDTSRGADNVAPTLQVMGRKGLWPGIELGAGATHLFDSRMWTISGYGKIALHEGFHHMPIPSIAIRGMFSRLLGARDLDMTTVSADISISHVFGVGKTFSITPYGGYQALMVFARTGILDATPGHDEYADGPLACDNGDADCTVQSEFVFRQQDVIVRHRPFVGARFIFSVLRIGIEAMFVPGGGSTSDVTLIGGGLETVTDQSGFQQQYTISLGLDF
ncbi:hypothetical protein G6O69_23575 [Pseudenhygromyxa sp. WMMC2535]|uniref:hypothetical protein n=1 Tax=Pseudenhygromyxa sp. WMMC2535 TaxID=2712867 RepID=UPI0015527639|nr:hypothetical protein [Pseudenhygromyxa sp. WMMC2535]NVB40839.1 hypothetical protein [Pseudenhygromyxa sp. WMMC2535]